MIGIQISAVNDFNSQSVPLNIKFVSENKYLFILNYYFKLIKNFQLFFGNCNINSDSDHSSCGCFLGKTLKK